jgi:hypothetical protein
MPKLIKSIFLTKSDSWGKVSNTDEGKVLSDTIEEFDLDVNDIINVQLITNSVGNLQFYIYHK